jgi:energy-coupling factor transport system substrate-specific component
MTATTFGDQQRGMWDVTARTIVYAAVGAALYGVLAQFSFVLPGTANVFMRPAFALVTFFGFAFGPVVGLFVGLVGNMIVDWLQGSGFLTYWNWSLSNGLAGLLAGVFAVSLGGTIRNRYALSVVAAVLAVVIGFLPVFLDIFIGTADDFGVALADNYIPVVIANILVAGILTPILVAAWDPIKDAIGR